MNSVNYILGFLSISIAIYSINIQLTSATQNTLSFEKVECVEYPKSGVTFTKCFARSISRNRLRIDMEILFNRTIETFFMQAQMFYQFSSNEYRPFLFNVWENFCGYMKGDKTNMFLTGFIPLFVKNMSFKKTCPYQPGVYFIKFDNVSVNALDSVNVLPAGRFRMELGYYEGFNGQPFGRHKMYFSVSDHRIFKF